MGPESLDSRCSRPFTMTPSAPCWTSKNSVCSKWMCLPPPAPPRHGQVLFDCILRRDSPAHTSHVHDHRPTGGREKGDCVQGRARTPLPNGLVVPIMRLDDEPAIILPGELKEGRVVGGEHGTLVGDVGPLLRTWR